MSRDNGGAPKISTNLSSLEVMKQTTPPNIIHHRGDLQRVTVDGLEIRRKDAVLIPNIGLVKCAPYDMHFVFRDARKVGWTLFCTCGSPAVVLNYDAYKQDASPQGALLACMSHASNGKHNVVNK